MELRERLSYMSYPRYAPFLYDTVSDCLQKWAKLLPNQEAVIIYSMDKSRSHITNLDLYESSMKFAKKLIKEFGIRRGQRVAVFVRNSVEWMIAFCGVILAGAIAVMPISLHVDTCVSEAIETSCSLMILDVRTTHLESKHCVITDIIGNTFTDLPTIVIQAQTKLDNVRDFDDILTYDILGEVTLPTLNPDDHCFMFQTSGSTGKSKYILHSHFAMINGSWSVADRVGIVTGDVFFNDRALGYSGGFPSYYFSCGVTVLNIATPIVLSSEDVDFLMETLIKEKATAGFIPPYLLFDLLGSRHRWESYSKLRIAIVGGQAISRQMLEGLTFFAENPICIYGMSELFGYFVAEQRDKEKPGELTFSGCQGIQVKIVDEQNVTVNRETCGEICIRSQTSSREYFATESSPGPLLDIAAWYHTGDVGSMTIAGNILLHCRVKEMIKRATVKIFPAMIEGPLSKHITVDQVVVVGVPDDRLYEEICACIVRKVGTNLTTAEIQLYAEKIFQPSLSPDGRGLMPGHFFIMDDIPRLATAKVNRLELKARCTELVKNKNRPI